jgi:NADH dehydrogenase [ubiquinone] 1 alpha subcomplex assembly factor 6
MATIPGYVKKIHRKTPTAERRSTDTDRLSLVAALVRRHDHDRFQTVLFAPAARREALFALYAFNYEIARARETVTQPLLGQIRLQWWRENIAAAFEAGRVRNHPVVEGLSAAIRDLALTRAHFDGLIDAREADLEGEPPATLSDLEAYAEATSARLVYLALEALGARDAAASEAGHHVGIAYAFAGLLRAMPLHARGGRRFIPNEILERTGLAEENYRARRSTPALRAASAELGAAAMRHLDSARALRRGMPRAAIAALLPAVIAGRALARLRHAGYDPFNRALAGPDPLLTWHLAAAALLGRF